MNRKQTLKRILIFLGICIAILAAISYFAFISIKHTNENISALTAKLVTEKNQQEYLTSTQKIVEQRTQDLAKINDSIVASDGDVQFIENLESLARGDHLNVSIDSLTVEDSTNLSKAGMTTLNVKVKVDGSFSDLFTFLSQIESSPFKIKVDGFSLVVNGEGVIPDKKTGVQKVPWEMIIGIHILKYR